METTRHQQILEIKHSPGDIIRKRQEITTQLQTTFKNVAIKIDKISTEELQLLFELYDEVFLYNWFEKHYEGKIKFSLSKRMTKSAGLTLCPKNVGRIRENDLTIEIRIGIDLFYKYDALEGIKEACGVKTESSLVAMQVVLEHELCHAIEFLCLHKSSCKGSFFKTLASNIFGHSESYHCLPTQRQIAKEKLGLSIGDTVTFEVKGKTLAGIINNINKRATVMVKDSRGGYRDSKGNRYSKYYVPLALLK